MSHPEIPAPITLVTDKQAKRPPEKSAIRRQPQMPQRTYHVYIMSSKSRTLYIGVTGFLMSRVLRHKKEEGGKFTKRYRINRLVYLQSFQQVGDAIARETELKKWRREKKIALIEERNPTWEDLSEGWGEPTPMRITQPPQT